MVDYSLKMFHRPLLLAPINNSTILSATYLDSIKTQKKPTILSASHFVSHGVPSKLLDVKVVLSEHKIDVQEETQTFQDKIDKGIQETRT